MARLSPVTFVCLETLDTLIVSKSIRFCFRLTIHRVESCAKYARILGWH